MLHTKYEDSRTYGFKQEDFFIFFPIQTYVTIVTPVAEPSFGPRVIIWTNFVEVY